MRRRGGGERDALYKTRPHHLRVVGKKKLCIIVAELIWTKGFCQIHLPLATVLSFRYVIPAAASTIGGHAER